MSWLDEGALFSQVGAFLNEDIGRGDITTQSTVMRSQSAKGRFIAKEAMVVCGLEAAEAVFSTLDSQQQIEAFVSDGDEVEAGKVIARTTTPGLRMLEKYAVTTGGGRNHRFGLDDGVLIKDNHVALAGGVATAVERARKAVGHLHKIEAEVSRERDLRDAVEAGADILLIDNQTPEETRRLVEVARGLKPDILLESSGGITLENVRQYAEAGVDLISVGALTHSARAVDISFKIQSA